MKPMNSEKQTRSQLKRAAIIEAARTTFKSLGVTATSMDKLAEVAGVSKRTVYNHFATKEALVMTLMTDLWEQALSQPTVAYDAHQPLEAQLQQLVRDDMDYLQSKEHIEVSRMLIGHLFYTTEMQQELQKVIKEENAILRWIKAATQDERLSVTDVEQAQAELQSLIKGQCFWPLIFQVEEPLNDEQKQQIAANITAMFLCRYKV
ncbi:TetR/AcrR family transcriptional regulator C-terminal domain-containing protein [Shewanella sp. SR43-4]|jgi:TetR/AcrR family transcriptional regulator of autoinduction and epiphytic fitness|uniref:TetR/AcrR family transcriptional regulator C-terminal domain-containing protein n=1 Tax=Shewanella TaxID=22 RepID=UPI000C539B86|nr:MULTISPECIES: TetR/AcrR family transcriptional regulator C-terminal domain-containing protein [Shewanella]NCQ45829.1 TetR/AcrR family transcriptional regulator [Shewanella frigidimarina]MBB1318590.1 TetR/AcrR family transcriptional regulator C-terminal domain-containing protein [Shewanella sp. SR43-4]MBB1322569.1 TetR/AcrR family transcriptional regulator C-terminal domain-containing protein [Shewanella sp. SR43-8]MBB1388062.1 TetR/AcrR family transcriptional regulator C-terminal domain-cont